MLEIEIVERLNDIYHKLNRIDIQEIKKMVQCLIMDIEEPFDDPLVVRDGGCSWNLNHGKRMYFKGTVW